MSEVFDYQQCIDAFMDSLAQLHGHIAQNCYHADEAETLAEIEHGMGLLAVAQAAEHTPEEIAFWTAQVEARSASMMVGFTEEGHRLAKESEARMEREWNEAWDYLRDNLRKWWC